MLLETRKRELKIMRSQRADDREQGRGSFQDTAVKYLAVSLVFVVLGAVFLPLAPALLFGWKADVFAQRSGFWAWGKHERLLKIGAVLLAVIGLGASAWALIFYAGKVWDGSNFHSEYLLYWAIFSLAIGLLFLPFAWLFMRWRISGRATARTLDDVVLMERITRARYLGARNAVAHRNGSKILRNGEAESNGREPVLGPVEGKNGAMILGEVVREWPSLEAMMKEKTEARAWVDKKTRRVVLPENAGDVRALVIAESGSGKSDFLSSIMQGARARGWRITFVDAKGDPADARKYASVLGGRIESKYNAFTGSAEDIRNRLFSVAWEATGNAEYYKIRAMRVFAGVQAVTKISSIKDLVERVRRPLKHIEPNGEDDSLFLDKEYDGGYWAMTFEGRFGRLEPFTGSGADTWNFYDGSPARVVPLNPVDEPERQVGLMILEDFKRYIAWRRAQVAAGVEMPQELFIFDEFAQLTGGEGKDPAVVISSLMETMRTAQAGLIAVSQSVPGFTTDKQMQERLLASGASIFAGRSGLPDTLSKFSGTDDRKESAATADGVQTSGRSQNTFVLPPKYVREAAIGEWFLLQAGSTTPFIAYRASSEQKYGEPVVASELVNTGGFF